MSYERTSVPWWGRAALTFGAVAVGEGLTPILAALGHGDSRLWLELPGQLQAIGPLVALSTLAALLLLIGGVVDKQYRQYLRRRQDDAAVEPDGSRVTLRSLLRQPPHGMKRNSCPLMRTCATSAQACPRSAGAHAER